MKVRPFSGDRAASSQKKFAMHHLFGGCKIQSHNTTTVAS